MDRDTRRIVIETTCGAATLAAGLGAALAAAADVRRQDAQDRADIHRHNKAAIARATARVQARQDAKRARLQDLLAAIRAAK